MGFTTVNGLPAHVLLVHFVIVLVPLAALLLVLAVCWPAARIRLGFLVPLAALLALILVPLTTQAGEWLELHIVRDPLIRRHAQLGDELLVWSAAVFLLSTLWWAMHSARVTRRLRPPRRHRTGARRAAILLVAALALVASAGSVVQVYRIGDSGAQAAWHDRASPTAGHR